MRTFVAIPVPSGGEAAHFLAGWRRHLAHGNPDVKWVAPGHFHITLRFLGDVAEGRMDAVKAAVEAAAACCPPFQARLDGCGAFPSLRQPRTLWVGVSEGAEPMRLIEKALAAGLQRAGFPPELKPFHPHVTVGRVRTGAIGRPVTGCLEGSAAFGVDHITLFESVLSPQGPRYTALLEAGLTGPEPFPVAGEAEPLDAAPGPGNRANKENHFG